HCLSSLSFSTGPASPAFYTLSLHDALPISFHQRVARIDIHPCLCVSCRMLCHVMSPIGDSQIFSREKMPVRLYSLYLFIRFMRQDRKSTRLNSSHVKISYAVFCLKKKSNYI